MAQEQEEKALLWPPTRRKIPLRRRKIPTIRLGGSKKPRKRFSMGRIWKKVRVRWTKLHHSRILRKLKEYYQSLIKDIVDAGATMESYQQRLLMETSFALPVMGVSFNNHPGAASMNGRSNYIM